MAVDGKQRKARTGWGEVQVPLIPFPEGARDSREEVMRLPGLGLGGVLGLGWPGDGRGADRLQREDSEAVKLW